MYGTGAFLPQGGGNMLEFLADALWGWHVLVLILAAGAVVFHPHRVFPGAAGLSVGENRPGQPERRPGAGAG